MSSTDTTTTPDDTADAGAGPLVGLTPLYRLHLDTGMPTPIPAGPNGTRMIIPVTGGTIEGDRITGQVLPPSGDWATMRADGSTLLDIRLTVLTDDGAPILITATGVAENGPTGVTLWNQQHYETGDERYAWLNTIQTVGRGTMDGQSVDVEVYALTPTD